MATAAAAAATAEVDVQSSSSGPTRKWKTGRKLESTNPLEKMWAVGGDFTTVSKWIPGIVTCDIVEGAGGDTGSIRKCRAEGFGEGAVLYEKLLVLNNEEHFMQYSLLENFLGFKDYVGTFKIEPAASTGSSLASADSTGTSTGCIVSWSMEVSPVEGKSEQEVLEFAQMMFGRALNGLEAFVSRSSTTPS